MTRGHFIHFSLPPSFLFIFLASPILSYPRSLAYPVPQFLVIQASLGHGLPLVVWASD